jgi:hypothetical protein
LSRPPQRRFVTAVHLLRHGDAGHRPLLVVIILTVINIQILCSDGSETDSDRCK